MDLWQSDVCATWRAALRNYAKVIRDQGVNGLAELDAWYREELPDLIAKRSPAHITHAELERVVGWKMKRGVWRARNRLLVAGNDPIDVKETTIQAFEAVPDVRKPITIIARLAGVGPATASAVLAVYRPDLFPFFDELVAAQIPNLGKLAFTESYYARYATALRERAHALGQNCRGRKMNAHEVGQALWAHSGGKIKSPPT